ncbi:sensor histidine kinase [Oenococcus sp. UCMA 16435]|nr:sensor histidine kinase [Oenococcus sp. UCMA 16435]MDI4584125.1 sensor protein LytS [Oenococcus sp. UCMA 14587]
MITLFLLLMQRVGTILILAFLLVNVPFFRSLLPKLNQISTKFYLILIFAVFAVLSNLTGVEITKNNNLVSTTFLTGLPSSDSIANTRTLVITVAGLVGGPFVGTIIGLIAGVHRVFQADGADSFYIFSSIIIGWISGMIGRRYSKKRTYPTASVAALTGLGMEFIQMLFILIFSVSGLQLVKLIFFPMMILNSFGTWVFMSIIRAYLHQEEQLRAVQTHDILELANKTLPYFSSGLTETSAKQAATIIQHYTNFDAIGITDSQNVLAHVGPGSDHHVPERHVLTDLSKRVLASGKMEVANSKEMIGCPVFSCPLAAAVVIPLIVDRHVAGTLKMYFTDPRKLTPVEEQLATGLASIFSSQLALGMAEEQSKLARDAEIKSLQAQVNPHFFFNAINTISALMRTNTFQAHNLLLELSTYFRTNLQSVRETEITLKQEEAHVQAYLSLEQSRFPNKYDVQFSVKSSEMNLLPPFTIQILVENAIRHAFSGRKKNNRVDVIVTEKEHYLHILVSDNGNGISPELLPHLGKRVVNSIEGTGTALENLNLRLIGLYGAKAALKIISGSKGTDVKIVIPRKVKAI